MMLFCLHRSNSALGSQFVFFSSHGCRVGDVNPQGVEISARISGPRLNCQESETMPASGIIFLNFFPVPFTSGS